MQLKLMATARDDPDEVNMSGKKFTFHVNNQSEIRIKLPWQLYEIFPHKNTKIQLIMFINNWSYGF